MYKTSNRKKLRDFIDSMPISHYKVSVGLGRSPCYLSVTSHKTQYQKHGDISREKLISIMILVQEYLWSVGIKDMVKIDQNIEIQELVTEQPKDAEENNQDLKANIFFIMAIAVIIIAAIYLIFVK